MKELLLTKQDKEIVNKGQVRLFFESLPSGKWLIKAERKDKRSNLQNSYYWACIVPMVKEGLRDMGFDEVRTNEDAHEILKHLFLKKQIVNVETGEVIETSYSTTKLTKIQFTEFFESVWKWASEYLNICIPGPNEQSAMFKKAKA